MNFYRGIYANNPLSSTTPYHPNDPSRFPIMILPDKIRNAILEVWLETQAPLPLVATSALCAISVACQHLYDAGRPNGMTSPCGLFFITIADSGERKTSSDKFFTKPIRDFEQKHIKENENKYSSYKTDLEIWKIKEAGLKNRMQRLVRRGENYEEAENQYKKHQESIPVKPPAMRMLFDDVSPAAIIGSIYNNWPSIGILSDEAGKLFNSKTFENVGLLNKLWDGDPVALDRHLTSASYAVSNARLTVSLMSQQDTFLDFLKKQGNLARDNGFLARCLTCLPISTQGYRSISIDKITLPNKAKPSLDEFQKTIDFLLQKSWQSHQQNSNRITINMSTDAAIQWGRYYNRIESEIGPSGAWTDIKDGAAKTAENIARLACLLQAFESCETESSWQISADMVNVADVVCMWYISQFKQLFGNQSLLSMDQKNATKVMQLIEKKWIDQKNYIVSKNIIRQCAPYALRSKAQFDAILYLLREQGKIQILDSKNAPGRKSTKLICMPSAAWAALNNSSMSNTTSLATPAVDSD